MTADTAPAVAAPTRRTLGLLALQGAFEDHEAIFRRIPEATRLNIVQVRKVEELDACDALVIPGGESTTMKIIAGTDSFMEYLKAFVQGGAGADGVVRKPRSVWGTCAGCILLSSDTMNQVSAGTQPVKRCRHGDTVGGLDVTTCRNFFGRQEQSFEAPVIAVAASEGDADKAVVEARRAAFSDFPGVFIRAPAILRTGPGVRALARVRHPEKTEGDGIDADGVLVAAETDRILVTTFHPELCQDARIHRYFVERFVLNGAA
mmetsp:Transcript_10995/g.17537  ORF Transcript_10995/g.17537 Transcript_10995/m.17537 type:complete len:262 (-) Transcript_10995:105-890(-)